MPRDLFPRVCSDADEQGDTVEAECEGVVADGLEWIAVDGGVVALTRAAEAEGYGCFGDRGAEEVVGEDDAAVV